MQRGRLDDYVQDFSRLSLNVTALDEHSRALFFVPGTYLFFLRTNAMREHPRTLSEAIRAAQTARQNAVLTRPRIGWESRNGRSLDTADNVASTEQLVSSQRFDRQKLTDEEREKLMRESRCFRCRSTGHLSKDCPYNNFGSQTSLANDEKGAVIGEAPRTRNYGSKFNLMDWKTNQWN